MTWPDHAHFLTLSGFSLPNKEALSGLRYAALAVAVGFMIGQPWQALFLPPNARAAAVK
ncbi:hypothetical protein [Hymenobacter nivis]|uniref:hypothetical protein n=1 Tax=Hymenobacter nivis TaxID=1850093 RepID=UPI0013A54097|nr:hypothetical protein [Hymenobacter nivis]